MSGNVWNRPSESFMVDMGIWSNIMKSPFPNVSWHSGTWSSTLTALTDQTLHQFLNLSPNWTVLPILTWWPNFGRFTLNIATGAASQQRTLTPPDTRSCPICSNVDTILSWTCHVYGPFEFWTSLGTSILLYITGIPSLVVAEMVYVIRRF